MYTFPWWHIRNIRCWLSNIWRIYFLQHGRYIWSFPDRSIIKCKFCLVFKGSIFLVISIMKHQKFWRLSIYLLIMFFHWCLKCHLGVCVSYFVLPFILHIFSSWYELFSFSYERLKTHSFSHVPVFVCSFIIFNVNVCIVKGRCSQRIYFTYSSCQCFCNNPSFPEALVWCGVVCVYVHFIPLITVCISLRSIMFCCGLVQIQLTMSFLITTPLHGKSFKYWNLSVWQSHKPKESQKQWYHFLIWSPKRKYCPSD